MARYGAVRYPAKRTSQGSDQFRGFCDRFFSRPYSTALSFSPEGVTGTSGYRFEYNLHLSKFLHTSIVKLPMHYTYICDYITITSSGYLLLVLTAEDSDSLRQIVSPARLDSERPWPTMVRCTHLVSWQHILCISNLNWAIPFIKRTPPSEEVIS